MPHPPGRRVVAARSAQTPTAAVEAGSMPVNGVLSAAMVTTLAASVTGSCAADAGDRCCRLRPVTNAVKVRKRHLWTASLITASHEARRRRISPFTASLSRTAIRLRMPSASRASHGMTNPGPSRTLPSPRRETREMIIAGRKVYPQAFRAQGDRPQCTVTVKSHGDRRGMGRVAPGDVLQLFMRRPHFPRRECGMLARGPKERRGRSGSATGAVHARSALRDASARGGRIHSTRPPAWKNTEGGTCRDVVIAHHRSRQRASSPESHPKSNRGKQRTGMP